MIQPQKVDYENYGRALRLCHENMELIVSTDIGPRILFFGEQNGENLLFNDLGRVLVNNSQRHTAVFGAGQPYYFYGGHRVWASPEHDPYSNCPDNDPVEMTRGNNSIIFTAPPQPVTGLQLSLEVAPERGKFSIINRVKYLGDDRKVLAAWGITQLSPGGRLILPQVTKDTSPLPNRHMTVWPYTNLTDRRVGYGKRFIVAAHDVAVPGPYKLGLNNEDGWMAYINKGCLFKKSFAWEKEKVYPDNNVNCEFYLNGIFVEAECLSHLRVLGRGATIEIRETWALKRVDHEPDFTDEEAIASLICGETEKKESDLAYHTAD